MLLVPNREMRILQVCSVTTFGGGERHLADLSHALADLGHEIYAAAVPGSPLWAELSFLTNSKLALSRRNYAKNLTALTGFVSKHNIEIVHAHAARDYHLAALAVRLASRGRLVLTRHALFPIRRINKPLLKNAGRIIAVSEAVAENLRRNRVIESSKITVVHNGVDVDRFDSPATCGRDGSRVLVGTVGHLAPIKGHDVFVRAAALTSTQHRDVHFVIIGEDKSPQKDYRKTLENLVVQLGLTNIISMPGWRDDMPAELSSLTLFVSAARSEPFGLAIVEAMAAGLPVVAAASEGALEIIEDGHTGRLVKVDDPEALAKAINDLLDNPHERLRLGRNAQLAARERYSLSRMAKDTERVYREVLNTRA